MSVRTVFQEAGNYISYENHTLKPKIVILTNFSSLAALKVVILTTLSAAGDENFINMTTVLYGNTNKVSWLGQQIG